MTSTTGLERMPPEQKKKGKQETEFVPDELVRQFARGNGIVFIGAGLSVGAGLPGWGDLLSPLVARIPGCPPEASAIEKAQFFENTHGRADLLTTLEDQIIHKERPLTRAHRILTALPVRYIFTTNYDRMIERSFQEAGRSLPRIIDDTRISLVNNSLTTLIKVHGDFDVPSSVVISTTDYDNYLTNKPAISSFLKAQLQTQTALFLGYSFNDENLRHILGQIAREVGPQRRNIFSLQFDPNDLVADELRRRGVRIVPLSSQPTKVDSLSRWLRRFVEDIRAVTPTQTDSRSFLSRNNVPSVAGDLHGRERVALGVLKRLQSVSPPVAITGPRGVGKSHVAAWVGRKATARSPDLFGGAPFDFAAWYSARQEQLPNRPGSFLPTRGDSVDMVLDIADLDEPLDNLLNVIATVLGFPKIRHMPATLTKAGAVSLLLSQYRSLVVIDDFDKLPANSPVRGWVFSVPAPSKVLVVSELPQPDFINAHVPGVESPKLIQIAKQILDRKLIDRPECERLVLDAAGRLMGNPQHVQLFLKLAIRQVNVDGFGADALARLGEHISTGDNTLLRTVWSALSPDATLVLQMTDTLSENSGLSRGALEAATGLKMDALGLAIQECLEVGLLEPVVSGRGERLRSSGIVAVLRAVQPLHPELISGAAKRLETFYVELLRSAACREEIDEEYWNSLVRPEMTRVDEEWASISFLLRRDDESRARRCAVFAPLVMHYLDSRHLQNDRLWIARDAADEIANSGGNLIIAARLYVDAIAWTELDRGHLSDAEKAIRAGLELYKSRCVEPPEEIQALAECWSAMVLSLKGDLHSARRVINGINTDGLRSWVRFRIHLVSGEVALRRGDYVDAIADLELCERLARSYGGEGGGYQTLPRLGLAYLAQNNLSLAEAQFEQLVSPTATETGRLAGRYGLALVRAARNVFDSGQEVDVLRRELLRVSGAHSFVDLTAAVLSNRLSDEVLS